ncbi:MAG TPA: ABC transporter ATP-binding protein, partial [Acetobacteraceae bacterium]|nr:ABC transporter ATP-binding protein [Acetobacteraceae bacterium]
MLLAAEGLVCGYGAADEILHGAALTVRSGEMVAIIGPNGAGKSTLLKAVAGMIRLKSGTIRLNGTAVERISARERARLGIAFVPQEANIFPSMTVSENLEMGGFLEPSATRRRVSALFERFPILAEKKRTTARTLSGGQRQVLAMAMALMVAPTLLLLDEPSAGLAPLAAGQLFSAIASIHREGTAIAMVEQNALAALALADRGLVLVDGRPVREGEARAMAADPEVRRLFLGQQDLPLAGGSAPGPTPHRSTAIAT